MKRCKETECEFYREATTFKRVVERVDGQLKIQCVSPLYSGTIGLCCQDLDDLTEVEWGGECIREEKELNGALPEGNDDWYSRNKEEQEELKHG